MKKGTVEVELKTGRHVTIPATISDSGLLAFHRQLDSGGNETKGSKARWSVSHIRTGRVIKHFRISTECRKLVKALDQYVWELGLGYEKTDKRDDLEGIVARLCSELGLE